MAQLTAVEWLYNQLDGFSDKEWGKIDNLFKQAKEMEKENIEEAYNVGTWNKVEKYKNGEQYYNETFTSIPQDENPSATRIGQS